MPSRPASPDPCIPPIEVLEQLVPELATTIIAPKVVSLHLYKLVQQTQSKGVLMSACASIIHDADDRFPTKILEKLCMNDMVRVIAFLLDGIHEKRWDREFYNLVKGREKSLSLEENAEVVERQEVQRVQQADEMREQLRQTRETLAHQGLLMQSLNEVITSARQSRMGIQEPDGVRGRSSEEEQVRTRIKLKQLELQEKALALSEATHEENRYPHAKALADRTRKLKQFEEDFTRNRQGVLNKFKPLAAAACRAVSEDARQYLNTQLHLAFEVLNSVSVSPAIASLMIERLEELTISTPEQAAASVNLRHLESAEPGKKYELSKLLTRIEDKDSKNPKKPLETLASPFFMASAS